MDPFGQMEEAFVCVPLYFSPSPVDLDCSLFAFSGKELYGWEVAILGISHGSGTVKPCL